MSWEYEPPIGTDGIADCYALNVVGETAWCCYYTDFPILRIGSDHTVHRWPTVASGARGFEAADFPGGPDDPYSDGHAYFAVDRWIAEEYEPQGPYRDGIISVRIPIDEYDSYWKAFERGYASTEPDGQTRRGTQLAIPSALVSGLNGYLRLWPT